MEGPQTPDALALQALAVLEQGLSGDLAAEKLEEALASKDAGKVSPLLLRDARRALARGDEAAAVGFLRRAFPPDDQHVVGATLRPALGANGFTAGAIGGLVIILAGVGLLRRRAADRARPHAVEGGVRS
jgi:hypothetical protein